MYGLPQCDCMHHYNFKNREVFKFNTMYVDFFVMNWYG